MASIADFIDHFYRGDENSVFSDFSASILIISLHRIHDLSIALTNAYGAQNWSCVVAASDCSKCAGSRQSVTPPALRTISRKANEVESPIADTGGQRSVSAEAFVRRNRWAFGFASVVGNPVPVPEATSVSLVNAPIRTSADVQHCEIAGGKGFSPEQALASCLGEAFERYALATADRRQVVVGTSSAIDGAINTGAVFGFPVVDQHPSIVPLTNDTVLEWMDAIDLHTTQAVQIPANLALCPYLSDPYSTIVAGSTNGAASGATAEDARTQALREIVERDAFWYYARTGATPVHIKLSTLPPDMTEAMRCYTGTFTVTLLPNPPMVQRASHPGDAEPLHRRGKHAKPRTCARTLRGDPVSGRPHRFRSSAGAGCI
ncbi:MAG: YcaO-like family protein [Candidatus Microbacterium colombiense]|nr:MAG: YcaO-like family protein [Microbacterium sp.]